MYNTLGITLIHIVNRASPATILLSEVLGSDRRIRESARAGDDVPVVIFCFDEIPEGLRSLLAKMYTSPSLTTSTGCEIFFHVCC